jgi:nitroimidazol reductase NimA-like FMN-containing flavoprotein (pyridoxamine 5'-phosphate oxidase superfamily)
MRKSHKEITELEQIREVLETCQVLRLAVVDEGVPYIIPLNYGYTLTEEGLEIYFHTPYEGRKIDILKKNPVVAFEMDCGYEVIHADVACDYNNKYRSITGNGTAVFLEGEEKLPALNALMAHYAPEKAGTFKPEVVEKTCVVKISAAEYAGKQLL